MRRYALASTSQDDFAYKIADLPPFRKQNLWGVLFVCVLLFIFVPSNYMGDSFPSYVKACNIVWLALCAVFIVLTILLNAKKGRQVSFLYLSMYSSVLLVLELWLILSQFSMILCCTDRGNTLNIQKVLLVFILSLSMLLIGCMTFIYVFLRVRKRVVQGHYRKGGKGFWDNHTRKRSLLRILSVAAPVIMSFSTASIFLGKFWNITWDKAYIPIVMIVAPSLMFAIFLPFSYLNAISAMRVYYIKRFGDTSMNVESKGEVL